MTKQADLEALKSILRDPTVHIAVGVVQAVEPTVTLSNCLCKVSVYPEEYPVVAKTSFPIVGPMSGVIQLPVAGDFVLLVQTNTEQWYIIGRLNSPEDPLPLQAVLGQLVLRALSGKAVRLESDTAVYIGRGTILNPSEPLVLGNVLKAQQGALYDKISDLIDKLSGILDTIISGPVAITTTPGNPAPTYPALATSLTAQKALLTTLKAQVVADKAQYVTVPLTNIVSAVAFTER